MLHARDLTVVRGAQLVLDRVELLVDASSRIGVSAATAPASRPCSGSWPGWSRRPAGWSSARRPA